MTFRIVLFHSLSAFITAVLIYFYDFGNFLLTHDKTKVTFVILAVYFACSLYLAWKREAANFAAIEFQRTELTGLGLLGTIIGLAFLALGSADIEAFKANVVSDLAFIFLPSGFGVAFSALLGQQLSLVYGVHKSHG